MGLFALYADYSKITVPRQEVAESRKKHILAFIIVIIDHQHL